MQPVETCHITTSSAALSPNHHQTNVPPPVEAAPLNHRRRSRASVSDAHPPGGISKLRQRDVDVIDVDEEDDARPGIFSEVPQRSPQQVEAASPSTLCCAAVRADASVGMASVPLAAPAGGGAPRPRLQTSLRAYLSGLAAVGSLPSNGVGDQSGGATAAVPSAASTGRGGANGDGAQPPVGSDDDDAFRVFRAQGAQVVRTECIHDRGSTFVVHACSPIRSADAMRRFAAAVRRAVEPRGRGASHDGASPLLPALRATHEAIYAVRCFETTTSGSAVREYTDDDGERYGAAALVRPLRDRDQKQIGLVATRWYGGVNLGPVRFTHLSRLGHAALDGLGVP